jgi:serine/threonine protein kinase
MKYDFTSARSSWHWKTFTSLVSSTVIRIKLENISLGSQGHAALTDFGLSKKLLADETRRAYWCCGAFKCMAPEVILAGADWWSVGVLTGFDRASDTEDEIFSWILTRDPAIPGNLSQTQHSSYISCKFRVPDRGIGDQRRRDGWRR